MTYLETRELDQAELIIGYHKKAAHILSEKIKTLYLQKDGLVYCEKVVKYTSLKVNRPIINLEEDLICKCKRALANFVIGKII